MYTTPTNVDLDLYPPATYTFFSDFAPGEKMAFFTPHNYQWNIP